MDSDLSIFQDGGRRPSWICLGLIWTTRENYFWVCLHFIEFVRINMNEWMNGVLYLCAKCSSDWCSISITWKFQYLARLTWKRLGYSRTPPPQIRVFGRFDLQNGSNINETRKGTPLHESASFEPSSVKIRLTMWPVYVSSQKGYRIEI